MRHALQLCALVVVCLAGVAGGDRSSGSFAMPQGGGGGQDQRAVAEFVAWFEDGGGEARADVFVEKGGLSQGAGDLPVGLLGLQASEQLRRGDTVLSVPLSMVICRDTILDESSAMTERLYRKVPSDEDLLTMFVIVERAMGRSSEWAPFMNVLPRSIPLPWQFDESEVGAIQDGAAIAYARRMRQHVQQGYAHLQPTLRALLKAAGLTKMEQQRWLEQKTFFWAAGLVGSRALNLRGTRYLVPMADMFRYRPVEDFREAHAGAHFERHHRLGADDSSFEVLSDRDVEAGGGLYEDYGDNSNTIYFMHHGMVPSDNPFDCADVDLPEFSTVERDDLAPSQERLQLLIHFQLSQMRSTCVSGGPLPETALRYMAIRELSAHKAEQCRPLLAAETSETTELDTCVGLTLSNEGYTELAAAVKQKLESYPTTADQDTDLLRAAESRGQGGDSLFDAFRVQLSENEKLAIVFRRSIKQRLQEAWVALRLMNSTTLESVPSADDSHQVSLPKLLSEYNDWLLSSGPAGRRLIAHLHAVPLSGSSADFGFVAEELMHTEDTIRVSTNAILDAASALRSFPMSNATLWEAVRTMFPDAHERLRGSILAREHALIVHLIQLRHDTALNQPWLPYVRTLVEHGECKSPTAASGFHGVRRESQLRRTYNRVREGLLQKFGDVFDEVMYSYEQYRWAICVLDQLGVWWRRERRLIPVLDVLIGGGNVQGLETGDSRLTLDTREQAIVFAVPNTTPAGEMIMLQDGSTDAAQGRTCAVVELAVCRKSENFIEQMSRLWSWGLYEASLSPCLSDEVLYQTRRRAVTDTATQATSSCSATKRQPAIDRLADDAVRFVRAATGVRSDDAARLCLRKVAGAYVEWLAASEQHAQDGSPGSTGILREMAGISHGTFADTTATAEASENSICIRTTTADSDGCGLCVSCSELVQGFENIAQL